jgi:hypothetical protein
MKAIYCYLSLLLLSSCYYGVNSETSQIGDLNSKCLSRNAWDSICNEYSITKISDSIFINGLKEVQNHFIKPEYILYFDSEPKELVGCDYSSVRVVYNPKITDFALDGLSPQLSDKEQVRIRNRVQYLLIKYQCKDGKVESLESMKEPAIFSKEYYNK